jgi:hypothetical protein
MGFHQLIYSPGQRHFGDSGWHQQVAQEKEKCWKIDSICIITRQDGMDSLVASAAIHFGLAN